MALLKCPECGNQVSSMADKCPNCGYPVSEILKESQDGKPVESPTEPKEEQITKTSTEILAPEPKGEKKINKKLLVVSGCLLVAILCGIVFAVSNRLTPEEELQVKKVSEQIEGIGEIGGNSLSLIESAEKAFNALDQKCQRHVKNRGDLKDARDEYDTFKANEVISAIDGLKEVNLRSADRISKARSKYDGLTETQQKKVNNLSTLEAAEEKLDNLQIENVISLISQIGDITLESEEVIKNARTAFDELSNEQQSKVTNINTLKQSEDQFIKLCVDNCISLISQIGAVSLDNSKPILDAEALYRIIPEQHKSEVTNYDTLKAARAEFDKLKKEKKEAEKKERLRNTIRVSKVWCSSPNSVGGVDAFISFTNKSDKTIKYITWTVTPYNAVGDVAYSEIGDTSTVRLNDTGPYKPGKGHGSEWYWDTIWYNWTIKTIKLSKIEIEYTDGTQTTINGDDVNYVIY